RLAADSRCGTGRVGAAPTASRRVRHRSRRWARRLQRQDLANRLDGRIEPARKGLAAAFRAREGAARRGRRRAAGLGPRCRRAVRLSRVMASVVPLAAWIAACRPVPAPTPIPTPTPSPTPELVRVEPPSLTDDLARESLVGAIDRDLQASDRIGTADCPGPV